MAFAILAVLILGLLSEVPVPATTGARASKTVASCSPTMVSLSSRSGVRCQVTVSGDGPTGNVTLSQYAIYGNGLFKSSPACVLVKARCSFLLHPADAGSLVAEWDYSGDGNNAPSSWSRILTIGSVPKGLRLTVKVSSTTLHAGQSLGINVSLYNALSTKLNISSARAWRIPGFPVAMWAYPGTAEAYIPPVEFMILKGHYSINGFQVAAGDVGFYPGTMIQDFGGSWRVDRYVFNAKSSLANITGTRCVGTCTSWASYMYGTKVLTSNFTVRGYWAYPFIASETWDVLSVSGGCAAPSAPCFVYAFPEVGPIAQHTFTPGAYTLVVTDEWGQAVTIPLSVK